MPTAADTQIHRLGQILITGTLNHASAQCFVSLQALPNRSALPVGDVMFLTTAAPFVAFLEGAIRKQTATVTAESGQSNRFCGHFTRHQPAQPEKGKE
jgi:hypothetical protein